MTGTGGGTGPVDGEAPEYVVAHLEEALARDPRVSEQGLHAAVEDGCVVVRGTVTTVERQAAIAAVAGDVAPDHPLRNEAEVADFPDRPEPEVVE